MTTQAPLIQYGTAHALTQLVIRPHIREAIAAVEHDRFGDGKEYTVILRPGWCNAEAAAHSYRGPLEEVKRLLRTHPPVRCSYANGCRRPGCEAEWPDAAEDAPAEPVPHTPGDWEIDVPRRRIMAHARDERENHRRFTLATVEAEPYSEFGAVANLHVLGAASKMLDALETVLAHLERPFDEPDGNEHVTGAMCRLCNSHRRLMRNAIDAARGRTA